MPLLEENQTRDDALAPDEVAVIAQHEHLTLKEAAIRGNDLMREPWGHAALRQMVWDTLNDARRRGNEKLIAELTALYRRTCLRYPSQHDRRTSPTRETHPFPPVRLM